MSLSLQLGLGLGTRLVRGGGFSPASLFAAGEQGAWYDPSDLSTLFQDSVGATPVTTPGQSVGLMLDKSQGLVLGSERVVNGTFNSDLSGWGVDNAAAPARQVTWTAGGARIQNDGSGNITFRQSNVFEANKSYLVTFTATVTGGSIDVFRGATAIANISASGSYSYIVGGAALDRLAFARTAVVDVTIDNVSVRELSGNHATQATAAQRPTYGIVPATGRRNLLTFTEQFDNAAWGKLAATVSVNSTTAPDGTTTADTLTEDGTTAGHGVQALSVFTTANVAKTISVYAKANGRKRLALGTATNGGVISVVHVVYDLTGSGSIITQSFDTVGTITSVGNGWFRLTLTATTTQDRFCLNLLRDTDTVPASYLGNGTSGIFVWGAQAETGSTATAYQRVGTAFDVTEAGVASRSYLSFDGTDDWMLTGNIVPGTDKAQVFAGVRNLSDAAYGTVIELGPTTTANAGTLCILKGGAAGTSPGWVFNTRGSAAQVSALVSSGYTSPVTSVVTGIGDIPSDTAILRANGAQIDSNSTDQGTGNYLTYPLYIGRRGGVNLSFNGQIFGLILRFGTNLTADEITQTETWLNGKTGAF